MGLGIATLQTLAFVALVCGNQATVSDQCVTPLAINFYFRSVTMSRRTNKSLWNRLAGQSWSRRPVRPHRLRFEALEDRRLLTAVTRWVDPNVTANGTTIFSDFTTAIAAAKNGDTIKVAAGNFDPGINVTKSLTIIGGQIRANGEATGPTIIHGDPSSTGFLLAANSITIENFNFTSPTTGIDTQGAISGLKIMNNIFDGDNVGIHLNTSTVSSAKTTTINGNRFVTEGSASETTESILIDGGRNITISGNFIEAGVDAAIESLPGQQINGLQILNNTIDDFNLLLNNQSKAKVDNNQLGNSEIRLAGGIVNSEIVGNSLFGGGLNVPPVSIGLDESLLSVPDTGNKISSNTLQFMTDGIVVFNGSHNTVSGNTIDGVQTDGILLNGGSLNTVSGNTSTGNAGNGLHLENSSSNTVSQNTANNNAHAGILLENGSSSNTLTGNIVSYNLDGIDQVDSNQNKLTGNTASFNIVSSGGPGVGFSLDSSNNNTLSGNTARQNGGGGGYSLTGTAADNSLSKNKSIGNMAENGSFDIGGDGGNTLTSNSSTNEGTGFDLFSASNTLTNNTATNDNDGFFIESDMNTIKGNIANNNFTGFELSNHGQNTISGNTANNNSFQGIVLMDGTDNTITGNTFDNNGRDGISVDKHSSGNTISGNTVTGDGFTQGTFDLEDDSSGGTGTAGTQNTWHKNKAGTSNPIGLLTA
jgi:parallel beta-helix repeat protein